MYNTSPLLLADQQMKIMRLHPRALRLAFTTGKWRGYSEDTLHVQKYLCREYRMSDPKDGLYKRTF